MKSQNNNCVNIGDKMKKIRAKKGLTQDALAKKANLPYTILTKSQETADKNKALQKWIKKNQSKYDFEIDGGIVIEKYPDWKINRKENYSGEYDLLYQISNKKMIKIEVKASRAVDFDSREPLHVKALAWKSKMSFDMNFQQVKPKCCDVFVWVGVWRDTIKYWVLASKEVAKNKYYSKGQHRGNTGEEQLHLKHDNIKEFRKYETQPKELLEKIIKAYKRQNSK